MEAREDLGRIRSELLKIHMQSAGHQTRHIVAIGTKEANDRLHHEIPDRYEVTRIPINGTNPQNDTLLVAKSIEKLSPQASIVILTDLTIQEVMYAHRISSPAKEKGFRVVSCYARPVFYKKPHDVGGLTYAGMFNRIGNLVQGNSYSGDYLEFGAFDGRTISLAWSCMSHIQDMRFFAFDSYKGIVGSTADESDVYPDGSYYSNTETFVHNMRVANADMSRVLPVQGNFLEMFKNPRELQEKYRIKRCRVAHIDCDVYKAAKASLDFISNVVEQGTILLFDEFHAHGARNDLGERRALKEWLEENPRLSVEKWHDYAAVSRAYILHVNKNVRCSSQ